MLRSIALVVLCATSFSLAACSSDSGGESGGESGGGTKTYEAAIAEYNEAKKSLTLPDGVGDEGWGRTLAAESDGGSVSYQDGAATRILQEGWACSWKKEWLAARGVDADREKAALEQLAKFPAMFAYTDAYDDESRKVFDEEVAAAKLGDPAAMQSDVDLNCAG
ncbi:hypothetical protein [Actinoplanes sp. NBRC 101535]|uniref:hypothetical protein n=1 Tax=Actinoplanes sp. NBRC 101535 TaxID=3032196 RepID=UPI0024A067E2|nr:hypothetical protein [Actinoplanes sp. NBRC 101535]GLY06710.1 hypothetical protein Acsp01_70890 [Actinoplanes sp. NBRC 101535]